ncbi:MAG: NADH:flavin oxidoreductase [Syntrophomonadaceae bacterium]|jgi:2,4-dienoyl-CoA reductase-like NADH-dependent reductase (Old Yellow Enzyme family)|nr:NADH:flavin oxidoreductase [Syntrophomonadaceae bacterium]
MKTIFEPVELGNLRIKNRIVRSATLEAGGAVNGVIAPLLKDIYAGLAEGGVSLIITGMMGVGHNSCAYSGMNRIYDSTFSDRFADVAETVHAKGSKITVQLGQCGAKATVIEKGNQPYAPSECEAIPNLPAKAMSQSEIGQVVNDFGDAALLCKNAGADAVQIHAAHGYLLSQFLSPLFNKRQDEYGGSIERRGRIVLEVYENIRKKVGADYPVLIKINYSDLKASGLTGDESTWVCQELAQRGIDAVELSSGIAIDAESKPSQAVADFSKGSFSNAALKLSSDVPVPVISVGGYRTPDTIENVLNQGDIAAVSLCRPLICEPALVTRWENGDRTKAKCISCNKCFGTAYGCKGFV